jgi:hypothetical protein
MITLNILPQEAKKEIKLKITYRKLKRLYLFLTLFIFLYGGIMIGAKLAMQNKYLKTIEKSSTLSKNLGDNYSQAIKEINSQVSSVTEIQKSFTPLTGLISEIALVTGPGIKMQSFILDRNTDTATFSGIAVSRNSLLEFKAGLENSNMFEKIDFPISNLIQQENIAFNLSAKIKSYDIER